MIKLINYLILQLFFISYSYSIEINSIVLSYDESGELFKRITQEFNDYSIENELDINLVTKIYTTSNITDFVQEYGNTIDHLLSKGSKKYDLYFYDVMYSKKYSQHLLDLNSWIPKEYIDMYSGGVGTKTCTDNGKWVGLPFMVHYSVLYYNIELFEKYKLDYPTTWDDLIEKAGEIYRKEKESGNEDIIGYNGLVPDDESCICSTLEFIHSFRESKEKPFPGFDSKEGVDALEKLKTIKNTLSNNEIFTSNDLTTINTLVNGNGVCLKFWYIPGFDKYKMSVLLGKNEDVSGTTIGGYNVGISKYIDTKHKRASIDALKFFTSKEFQKNLTISEKVFSGINSIYDDEEVCASIDCNLAKNFQPVARTLVSGDYDYDEYTTKYRKYIHQFLYGNETASNALKKILDITKIYTISLDTDISKVGLIFIIIMGTIIAIMIMSLLFLLHPKAQYVFRFMTNDFWILTVLGCIFYLGFIVAGYGTVTRFKCHMKILSQTFAFTFCIIPSLHRLVCNFPKKNHFSGWIHKNRYIFLLSFIVLDVVLNEILVLSSYSVEIRDIDEGKNFEYCKQNNGSGIFKLILILFVKIIIIAVVSLLLYLEWNLKRSIRDVRLTFIAIYISCLLYVIFLITWLIKIDDYIELFILQSTLIVVISLVNYILLFGVRIRLLFKKTEYIARSSVLSSIGTYSNTTNNDSNTNTNTTNTNKPQTIRSKSQFSELSFINRIMYYHYSDCIIGAKPPAQIRSKQLGSVDGNPVARTASCNNNPRPTENNAPSESMHTFSFA